MLPASAGMIPGYREENQASRCAPRIRGDDPTYCELVSKEPECSQHPRG